MRLCLCSTAGPNNWSVHYAGQTEAFWLGSQPVERSRGGRTCGATAARRAGARPKRTEASRRWQRSAGPRARGGPSGRQVSRKTRRQAARTYRRRRGTVNLCTSAVEMGGVGHGGRRPLLLILSHRGKSKGCCAAGSSPAGLDSLLALVPLCWPRLW